jgi:UDP-GlcNAc:undecaprenyl-phosphate GlcNAc-1-phosphate transferase
LPSLAALGVIAALTILIWTRSFGHAEFRLVVVKTLTVAKSFLDTPGKCLGQKQQTRVPLQGSGEWDMIWEPLVEFAKTHDLAQIKIDLSLSWLHEGYHATWKSVRLPEKAHQLHVRLPLFTTRAADNAQVGIGRLEILAAANDPVVYQRISDLTSKLTHLSPQIDEIITGLEAQQRLLREQTDDSPAKLRICSPEANEPVTRIAG